MRATRHWIVRVFFRTAKSKGASGEDLEIKSAVGVDHSWHGADKNKKIEKGPREKKQGN